MLLSEAARSNPIRPSLDQSGQGVEAKMVQSRLVALLGQPLFPLHLEPYPLAVLVLVNVHGLVVPEWIVDVFQAQGDFL